MSIPPSSILKQSYKFKDEEAFSGYRAANQEPIIDVFIIAKNPVKNHLKGIQFHGAC